jgi:Protein of unknown function (DUF1524)
MAFDGNVGPLALTLEEKQTLLAKANGGLHKRSATLCKYLLKRISADDQSDVLVESLSEVSIEHILPTNLSPKSSWLVTIPDPRERDAANRSLGNLTLLSWDQNRAARNMGLEAKLRVYFPDGRPTPHAITNELMGVASWTLADITRREALMLATVRRIAGIHDGTKPQRPKRKGSGGGSR